MTDPTQCNRCGQPHAACAAHRRDGQPCRTVPMRGQSVCRMHGAMNPAARANAAHRQAEAAATAQLHRTLAEAYGHRVPDVDPGEAMLQAVAWKHAEVVALRVKVAALDDEQMVWGTTRVKEGGDDHGVTQEAKPNIWWTMLRSAEEQLVKFAAAARTAGCDERLVRIAERQGEQIAGVLRRVLDALDLTDAQRVAAPDVVARELRAVGELERGGDAA